MNKKKIERISTLATKSIHERVTAIDLDLVQMKAHDSLNSVRKREIHIFHTGDNDTLQRMLNAIQPGSYIVPHRHIATPKAESLILLQGSLGFVPFNDDGIPDEENFVYIDKRVGVFGVDYRAKLWHTFFALEENTVIFEVKPGPYDSLTDKEFAPWAPLEDSSESSAYLANLVSLFRKKLKFSQ